MNQIVSDYLSKLADKYKRESSSEYSYRTEFEQFLNDVFGKMGVKKLHIDHDAKSKGGNKPDFVIFKGDIPILYIETKDIGVSLDKTEKSEQMSRYYGYSNLILTDYLEFRFYRNGIKYGEPITIANVDGKSRIFESFNTEKHEQLVRSMIDFAQSHKEPIKSGLHLAKIMGGRSRRIRDNIYEYTTKNPDHYAETIRVYKTIKKQLIHDLTLKKFANLYAQTIVYGLFVARFHDDSPDDFTRQEARDLIPKSNPFLLHFFDHIVGPNLEPTFRVIIDELCEVFSHSDIEKLMTDYYNQSSKSQTTKDPVIHFYEDFLKEYDPILRKKMGAYYTPTPVVEFMVRSVDQILKNEFGLKDGLADTTKLNDGKTHRVQILDPATGTGTFLSSIIDEIYKKYDGPQQGRWPKYVYNNLLPRLHGFELMMTAYTIAHLKIGMTLKDTGFKYFNNSRLGIYLTNSLENDLEGESLFSTFGFADSIAQESREAHKIKNKTPIMVVIGNPPYSGESNNKIESVESRINEKYLYRNGIRLKEKGKKNWLQDDYVKFISLAEDMINKNDSGIVSLITNNGYIDNPTFRNMRYQLRKSFDKIFILDLHGNSNKNEKSPDGSVDENVFDIKQGVSIIFAIKSKKQKNELAQIFHHEIFGKRKKKFEKLTKQIKWVEVFPDEVMQYFRQVADNKIEQNFQEGFSIDEIFKVSGNGIITSRDKFIINYKKESLLQKLNDFKNLDIPDHEISQRYNLKDNSMWSMSNARKNMAKKTISDDNFLKVNYRPFDKRYIYYDSDVIMNLRKPVMDHYNNIANNIGLLTTRMTKSSDFNHAFVTDSISEAIFLSSLSGTNAINFPLYIKDSQNNTVPNFDEEISEKIMKITGNFNPVNLLDYIYAHLYSISYREKFNDLLKLSFPRIPYPKDRLYFKKLSELGKNLRELHLMVSPLLDEYTTSYSEMGSDKIVIDPVYSDHNVYINENQYFGKVPEVAWNFYIGGYQPAQKWLKDRRGRILADDDIEHYQRMITALVETDRIMKEIDKVIEL